MQKFNDGLNGNTEKHDESEAKPAKKNVPKIILYQNRDILDLSYLKREFKDFVQYTILPESNLNCFLQNRAQYWRLSSNEKPFGPTEKCNCCEFTFPSTNLQPNQKPVSFSDSLLDFLRSTYLSEQEENNAHYGNQNQPSQIQEFFNQNVPHSYNQQVNPFMNSATSFPISKTDGRTSSFPRFYKNTNNHGLYKQF